MDKGTWTIKYKTFYSCEKCRRKTSKIISLPSTSMLQLKTLLYQSQALDFYHCLFSGCDLSAQSPITRRAGRAPACSCTAPLVRLSVPYLTHTPRQTDLLQQGTRDLATNQTPVLPPCTLVINRFLLLVITLRTMSKTHFKKSRCHW